jgi:hypothetical protein
MGRGTDGCFPVRIGGMDGRGFRRTDGRSLTGGLVVQCRADPGNGQAEPVATHPEMRSSSIAYQFRCTVPTLASKSMRSSEFPMISVQIASKYLMLLA